MNSKEIFKDILLECLESLNTPLSLSLHMQYEADALHELPSLNIYDYDDYVSYYKDAQAVALFSKNLSFTIVSEEDLERRAESDFFACEAKCRLNNDTFASKVKENQELFSKIKTNVLKLIGRGPDKAFYENPKPVFGPGSTSSCSDTRTTYLDKLEAKPECTTGAIDFLEFVTRGCPLVRPLDYHIVQANRFFTVPKNYKNRRACCVEPHLNTWFQRAIGLSLKRALYKRASYNLDVMPDRNKYFLKHHFDGIATLDLKQASDTIYYKIVKYAFPEAWFQLMNQARSLYTDLNGTSFKLEKFSSMGNGFTFELESILFLSIVRSVVPTESWKLCTVFGDDILVPAAYGPRVRDALEAVGFTLNLDKTFLAGCFKESCGVDMWYDNHHSICVRPVFLRKFPNLNKPKEIIAFINYIRRISLRSFGIPPKGEIFGSPYKRAIDLLPNVFRHFGEDPYEKEDLFLDVPMYIHSDFEQYLPSFHNGGLNPRLESHDSDGWIHHSSKKAKMRIIEQPTIVKKPSNYRLSTQIVYALSGFDPAGVSPRNSPTRTIIKEIQSISSSL